MNDAISIILFNTVNSFGRGEAFTGVTPFKILGNFLVLTLGSFAIGLVVGLMSSYVFKYARYLTHSAIVETMALFSFGYLSYSIAELFSMSGIISLLTCGIVMAHYTWYNLSPQGKHVSSSSF